MKMPYFFGVIYASKIPQTVILLKNGVGSENVIQLRFLFNLKPFVLFFKPLYIIFDIFFYRERKVISHIKC